MQFDVIVVGSGPGGYRSAITAAHLGAKVALVEKGLAGGTCLNQGCIPKKTLLHLAGLIHDVNALQGRGLVGRLQGDFGAAIAHKNAVIEGIRDNFGVWLKRLGIQVFYGTARFSGARTIEVDPGVRAPEAGPGAQTGAPGIQRLQAPRIILAVGSEPAVLEACRPDGSRILTSRDFMFRSKDLPESVLCVGGGAIGVELGFLLHQFGSRVCIAEASDRLLNTPRIPERAADSLERKFKRLGVDVRKNTTVEWARPGPAGVDVRLSDGVEGRFAQVLVATGRVPRTGGLGLEEIGIELIEGGFVRTNEYLETSIPGIYAVGDMKPGPMTANAALHDAKIAAANAVHGNKVQTNYFRVPFVIHSAFEIAAVGLTEDQADDAGFDPDVARASYGGSGKARAHHDFEGFVEVVHDAQTGQLLGGCIVGPEAGEQIHMLTAACQSTRGLWFFKDLSYSHPSWCEELETAIDPCTSAFGKCEKGLMRPGIYAPKLGG
ncbi:MAG: NAD(P)/FAD-dependent oxidoreductase [Betaproteobacteria bacterium]|nr:NAD(P)/FAD-dependent oxidoreductase [Betaproteobacteria bacterium]